MTVTANRTGVPAEKIRISKLEAQNKIQIRNSNVGDDSPYPEHLSFNIVSDFPPLGFKISGIFPLINVTAEGLMVNNMVLSTEIEWIGYEHKRNMLQVEFIAGPVYQYDAVPERTYEEFLAAPSYGRFFEANIKGKFPTRKIR